MKVQAKPARTGRNPATGGTLTQHLTYGLREAGFDGIDVDVRIGVAPGALVWEAPAADFNVGPRRRPSLAGASARLAGRRPPIHKR